jgi:hypothetical protein
MRQSILLWLMHHQQFVSRGRGSRHRGEKVIAVAGATGGSQGGGAARALLADPDSGFTVRAPTRNPDSPTLRSDDHERTATVLRALLPSHQPPHRHTGDLMGHPALLPLKALRQLHVALAAIRSLTEIDEHSEVGGGQVDILL